MKEASRDFARVFWEEFNLHENDSPQLRRILAQLRERKPEVCGLLVDCGRGRETFVQLFDERYKGEFHLWHQATGREHPQARFFLWEGEAVEEVARTNFFSRLSERITYK